MIAPFLTILNQLLIFHWQTESYAQHKALGKAYENLQELFDKFIETYYGKYGRPTKNTEYTTSSQSYLETDMNIILNSMFTSTLQNINEMLSEKDNDLLNIYDEIEGEFNHIKYLLTLN